MRCEIVAIGSELLLGAVDTNSAWLSEHLAAIGVDCHHHSTVGDNTGRIAGALEVALSRSDAVITTGGLGPTQDDVTREAIALLMGVPLEKDPLVEEALRARHLARGTEMTPNNLRQAEVPRGAQIIPQTLGSAPGLHCLVAGKPVYALPGVPREMKEMASQTVFPDLVRQAGSGAIASRTLRTFGVSESALAARLSDYYDRLGQEGSNPTLAFLASAAEGVKVRITAKAASAAGAESLLEEHEQALRSLLGEAVFGLGDVGLEDAAAAGLCAHGLSLGLAESVTGGLVSSRLVSVPGASGWYRGAVVSYDSAVKYSLLGVAEGPVVTERAAVEMAQGAIKVLGSQVGLSLTGVAGPGGQEGMAPGTVFLAVVGPGDKESLRKLSLPGNRETIRELAASWALWSLHCHLLDL